MARVTVQYDASGGSDSNSGAGGTPVTGTNGDISGNTITLNETKDLSAFAAGDVVYYAGNSGDRHLFEIASFTGGAATCTAIVTVESATAARTGSNWSVGGKRQTIQADTSRRDSEDAAADWTFDLAAGTYNLGATMVVPGQSGGQCFKIQGAGRDSTTIMLTANAYFHNTSGGVLWLDGLEVDTNAGTKTLTYLFRAASAASRMFLTNCRVQNLQGGYFTYFAGQFYAIGTHFKDLVTSATVQGTYGVSCAFYGCEISGCGSYGVELGSNATGASDAAIIGCVIRDNTDSGIYIGTGGARALIINNTIHDNGGDGIEIGTFDTLPLVILNNIMTSNAAGYGLRGTSAIDDQTILADYNAYGWTGDNNASGARLNLTAGAGDVTLTADPFTDEPTTKDFTLNSTAGGGAALTDTGYGGLG